MKMIQDGCEDINKYHRVSRYIIFKNKWQIIIQRKNKKQKQKLLKKRQKQKHII